MKHLVTGMAGFIGSHLAARLAERGDEVVGIDSFLEAYPREVKEGRLRWLSQFERVHFVEGDLFSADIEALLSGVDVVFHQAAQAGVRASWGDRFEVYTRNNILVTQRLLEACKGNPLQRFVYASSSSVYGDHAPIPTAETAPTRPYSPYGVTKLAGEHLAMLYQANYGVPSVALRYFTVFGPRPRPDMAFCKFARAILSGEPIRVYGDGEQSRGFTHVNDVVEANLAATVEPVVGEVFNIGGAVQLTVNQVIERFETVIGKTAVVIREARQEGDVSHTMADTTKARMQLRWEPRAPFMDCLADHVQSVKEFYGL